MSDISTRKIRILLPLLLSLLLLTCCRKEPEGSSSVMPESRGELTESTTEELPIESFLPDSATTISAEDHFYDITAYLPRPEGMVLWDHAVPEKGRLLLLYSNAKISEVPEERISTDGFRFTVISMELRTGSSEKLVDNRRAELTADEQQLFFPQFVNLDPLIISETPSGVFYDQNKDRVIRADLGKDNYFERFIPQNNGRIFYIDSTQKLCELCMDEDGMHPTSRWNPDKGCSCYELYRIMDDEVIFTSIPELDDSVTNVFFRIRLSTGKKEEVYTMVDEPLIYPSGFQCDYQIFSHYGPLGFDRLMIRTNEGLQYDLAGPGAEEPENYEQEYPDGAQEFDKTFWGYGSGLNTGYFGICDGYLFGTVYNDDDTKLVMWDFSQQEPHQEEEPKHKSYKVVHLYDIDIPSLKKEIEDELGIIVCTNNDVQLDYYGYTAEPENDKTLIYHTLLKIRDCYRRYPPGFLEQLNQRGTPLRIYILRSLKGSDSDSLSSARGLASADADGPYIAFATDELRLDEETIFHETTHCVYDKLMNDSNWEGFYDDWGALNPPDFEYAFTYNEDSLPDDSYTSLYNSEDAMDSIYFVRAYSKTYQTEDVADIFANLMAGNEAPEYYASPHLQAKCSCLFRYIREYFDTTDWPEKAEWEERLETIKMLNPL